MSKPKIDAVVAAYIKLRDHKDEVKSRHKDELAPINEQMAKLEGWLHRELNAQGVDSFKTKAGTAFVQKATSVTVAEWDVTLPFIREHDLWDLLEARVSKSAVQDYVESTKEVPPGVNVRVEEVVRVRR